MLITRLFDLFHPLLYFDKTCFRVATVADFDGDGIHELFTGGGKRTYNDGLRSFFVMYKQKKITTELSFILASPAEDITRDITGQWQNPLYFHDWDGDGDLDMISPFTSTYPYYEYYENVMKPGEVYPTLEKKTLSILNTLPKDARSSYRWDNSYNILDNKKAFQKTSIVDLDQDGDPDIIVSDDGWDNSYTCRKLIYFKNTGTQFQMIQHGNTGFPFPIFSGSYSSLFDTRHMESPVSFTDFDGDQDLDMFYIYCHGSAGPRLFYAQNTGSKGSPLFSTYPVMVSGHIGSGFGDEVTFLTVTRWNQNTYALVADIRGVLILLIAKTTALNADTFQKAPDSENPFATFGGGGKVMPTFADLNGDNLVDLVYANYHGVATTTINAPASSPKVFMQGQCNQPALCNFGGPIGVDSVKKQSICNCMSDLITGLHCQSCNKGKGKKKIKKYNSLADVIK